MSKLKLKFRVGQVVALRGLDGGWIYSKIWELVDDGTARLVDVDNRRPLNSLRPLTKREKGQP